MYGRMESLSAKSADTKYLMSYAAKKKAEADSKRPASSESASPPRHTGTTSTNMIAQLVMQSRKIENVFPNCSRMKSFATP